MYYVYCTCDNSLMCDYLVMKREVMSSSGETGSPYFYHLSSLMARFKPVSCSQFQLLLAYD